MNSIISLFKIHVNRYYKTTFMMVGGLLLLLLFSVSVQIYAKNQLIDFQISGFAPLLSFIGIFIFVRGRDGSGKFLSRLPVSEFQVFVSKLIIGILFYIVVVALFLLGASAVSILLHLADYQTSFGNMFEVATLIKGFYLFLKGYLWFVFMVSLVLFLERWMSAGEAISLIIFVPILLMIGFPLIFKFCNVNIDFSNIEFFESMVDFIRKNAQILKVGFFVMITTVSMFLFRLRNFKSF